MFELRQRKKANIDWKLMKIYFPGLTRKLSSDRLRMYYWALGFFSRALSDLMKPHKSDEFEAKDAHNLDYTHTLQVHNCCFQKIQIQMPISRMFAKSLSLATVQHTPRVFPSSRQQWEQRQALLNPTSLTSMGMK